MLQSVLFRVDFVQFFLAGARDGGDTEGAFARVMEEAREHVLKVGALALLIVKSCFIFCNNFHAIPPVSVK
jgi:hypothetical protein